MRALIVDDHPVVISGCRALLAGEPDVEVDEAADAESAEAIYFARRPDVAVVDLNLPGLSGLELCRRLLARDARANIVIFTMNDDPVFAARAIEAGAKGYIGKNDDPALFVEAVRRVSRGEAYLDAGMARRIAFLRANAEARRTDAMSPREREILAMLAAGRAMSEIADALGVSDKTVANNCTALKQKVGARSSLDLLRFALEANPGAAQPG